MNKEDGLLTNHGFKEASSILPSSSIMVMTDEPI